MFNGERFDFKILSVLRIAFPISTRYSPARPSLRICLSHGFSFPFYIRANRKAIHRNPHRFLEVQNSTFRRFNTREYCQFVFFDWFSRRENRLLRFLFSPRFPWGDGRFSKGVFDKSANPSRNCVAWVGILFGWAGFRAFGFFAFKIFLHYIQKSYGKNSVLLFVKKDVKKKHRDCQNQKLCNREVYLNGGNYEL